MKANPIVDPRIRSTDIQYKDYLIDNTSTDQALAKKDITYSSPIISSCRDYYLYVARFAISHMAIPLYFFDNSDDKYSVTISVNGVDETANLIYIPIGNYSNFGYTQPVFYYEQFCQMINEAFVAACGAFGVPITGKDVPFIEYDPNTEKFTVYVYIDRVVNVDPTKIMSIYFSSALFQQLQFLEAEFLGYNIPKSYKLILYVKRGFLNHYEDPDTSDVYYTYEQERSALYLLNDVQNIAFISNKIPSTKEFVPNLQNSTVLTSRSILCNFIPDLGQGRNLSEYQYYPQGFPNLINMESDEPLSAIDVQIYFVTKGEVFYPLYLEPGESVSIRFAFYKKSMFNNNYTSLFTDKSGIGY